jgi:prolyl-tRNA synthetase
MRRTQLFCETLRQSPNDSEVAGHSLLLRGGFVQPLSAGIFRCCLWDNAYAPGSRRFCARR